ncbi:unnamed protein product [Trichogramma brassicae]|uniref:Uncharacterized protein n=1 Tax=Trichogramma brassicae TaxID=86971 RepID=A0A6H5HYG4_9HYME|nr:unnamed protein product [Trichogramma brassicae]
MIYYIIFRIIQRLFIYPWTPPAETVVSQELREVVIHLSVPPLNPRNDVRDESVCPPTFRRDGPLGLPFLDRPSSFFTPNVFEAAMIQPRALVDE